MAAECRQMFTKNLYEKNKNKIKTKKCLIHLQRKEISKQATWSLIKLN